MELLELLSWNDFPGMMKDSLKTVAKQFLTEFKKGECSPLDCFFSFPFSPHARVRVPGVIKSLNKMDVLHG